MRVCRRGIGLGLGLFGLAVTGWAQSGPAGVKAGGAATATVVQATPALWKVQGAHETVYLFGTVHVLKPNVEWDTGKVKAAFGASDGLYLEVADINDAAALQPMMMQLGMDADHPLSTMISKADLDQLDAAAKSMGAPGEGMFETFKPWLAYLTVSLLPVLKSGYAADSGVDVKLETMAKAENKPVMGLETASQQLHYFADMPEKDQVELLHRELQDLPKENGELDQTVDDWAKGDVAAIAQMENGDFRVKEPELYQKLVVERNERWAEEIAGLLKGDKTGTIFVAVGAAHLAGPESVQVELKKLGFTAVRE